MSKVTKLLALAAIGFLAGCGGGEPSESEMKAAFQTELAKAEVLTGKIEILSFKKDKCTADGEKYRCTFETEISMKNPISGEVETQKSAAPAVFEKINDNWTILPG